MLLDGALGHPELVADTGVGLSEIEQLVLSVNTHMDAIATAAQEQSAGLSEVNTAVNHMDQAMQQNAAMVEEQTAASHGLAQEAAQATGSSTPMGALALQLYRLLLKQGNGKLDFSAVQKLFVE